MSTATARFEAELDAIRVQGLFKSERVIVSPQSSEIRLADGKRVLNFCANNYLGLADHPEVIAAAHAALDEWGFGLASVRFICGTQELHKQLEDALTRFLGTEDTILYSSCFDANGGLFEVLLSDEDAVISDELNHASIIDGCRLSRAAIKVFPHKDVDAARKVIDRLYVPPEFLRDARALLPKESLSAVSYQHSAPEADKLTADG